MSDQTPRRARHAVARAATLGGTALLSAALLATWQATPTTGWNQGGAEATVTGSARDLAAAAARACTS